MTATAREVETQDDEYRDAYLNGRTAIFYVAIPKGFTPEEVAMFKRDIKASLAAIVADAVAEVEVAKLTRKADQIVKDFKS